MSKALIAGINQVAVDKGLDREIIFEAIEAALVSAYKRNYGFASNVSAEVDRVSGEMKVFTDCEVVDEVVNEHTEVEQDVARKVHPDAELGDVVKVEAQADNFGRIAAQTAKQVILQRIREAERDIVYENFAHRVGEIINAQVRSVDHVSGAVTLLLEDKHEVLLMRDDQIPKENVRRGDYLRVYVVDVHKSTRGPVIKLSRTHRNLLRRLMEQEIPEIRDGVVEIKSIAREPGARSKASVMATVPGVDPVGSCVGMRGLRIQNIVNELSGEKIDVVEWSSDTYTYISNALSPAKVTSVLLEESGNAIKTATVVVPDRQLSLAIGKEGQNARLAAKLTGWRIDIKSESEAEAEGLDKLIEEQAATVIKTSHDNLLAYAEEILRSEDEMVTDGGEDRMRQAAKQIEEMGAESTEDERAFDVDLPPLIDLDNEEDSTGDMSRKFEEAAAAAKDEEQFFIEDFPTFEEEETASLLEIEQADEDDEAEVDAMEERTAEPEVDEDLPEVITADMLRARMEQRKEIDIDSDDFEIPAELLVGLEDDELEEERKTKSKSRQKNKSKEQKKGGKKKGGNRRRQPTLDDDEYDVYY